MTITVIYPVGTLAPSIFKKVTSFSYNGDYFEVYYDDYDSSYRHAKIYRISKIIVDYD